MERNGTKWNGKVRRGTDPHTASCCCAALRGLVVAQRTTDGAAQRVTVNRRTNHLSFIKTHYTQIKHTYFYTYMCECTVFYSAFNRFEQVRAHTTHSMRIDQAIKVHSHFCP